MQSEVQKIAAKLYVRWFTLQVLAKNNLLQ